MSYLLTGRTAVVTGAARGIGRAIALQLAKAGADVVIADIDLAAASQFGETLSAASVEDEIRAFGRQSFGYEGNLGLSSNCSALIAETVERFGKIDILVNCAGGALTPHESSSGATCSDEDIRQIFAVNFDSMAFCSRAAVRHMRERKSGVIVNIASTAGYSPAPDGSMAHYAAAKAAVINFTRALASEVGPDGIRVNTVAPGLVMTSRVVATAKQRGFGSADQGAYFPLRRLGTPEDIAQVVEFFASDQSAYVTGQCLAVNGGNPAIAS